MSHGLAGGYPGIPGRYVVCRGARPEGTNSSAPLALREIGGTHEHVSFGVYRVRNEDVFYVRWNGGGGVRDPLARDVDAVARDVAEGVVSNTAARDLFGVIVSDGGRVDAAATEEKRNALRKSRAAARTTVNLIKASLHSRACACNGDMTKSGLHAVDVRERQMSAIGPAYSTGPDTMLSEMICKECGALLDAQVTKRGAGLLLDGSLETA